jgi:hypothetical protein
MTHRKSRRRLVLVALLAFVLGTTAFAYAATVTFGGGTSAGNAGEGSGTISGYDVQSVHYALDNASPVNITGVTFTLTPATATTVKARINGLPTGWVNCTGGAPWSCDFTGQGVPALAAASLQVAAAS